MSKELILNEDYDLSYYENFFNEATEDQILNFLTEAHYLAEARAGSVTQKVATTVKRVDNKISKKVDKVGDSASEAKNAKEKAKLRTEIIEGKLKLSTILKGAIKAIGAGGAGAAVGGIAGIGAAPVALTVAALGTFLALSRRGKIKKAEKKKLLFELKSELPIIKEKIRDAEAEGDKKKKYQYMRLEKETQKMIDKIRYGMSIKREAEDE